MYGCSALSDYIDEILRPTYVDAAWGGIWGHVLLGGAQRRLAQRSVRPAGRRPIRVAPSAPRSTAKPNLPDGAKLEVFDQRGRPVAEAAAKPDAKLAAGQVLNLEASLPGAKLWTPSSPTLYTARLSLRKGEKTVDAIESRFGMRQFAVDGPHLLA